MNIDIINNFLEFGYVPQENKDFIKKIAEAMEFKKYRDINEDDCNKIFSEVIEEEYSRNNRGELNCIPISGGIDSRLILSELIKNLDRKDIITVTFGTPGSWDYDIGVGVAKYFSIENIAINLTSKKWKWDEGELKKLARQFESPIWLFDIYVNNEIKKIVENSLIWTGFMGDPIAGSHLHKMPSETFDGAICNFKIRNKFSNMSNYRILEKNTIKINMNQEYSRSFMTYEEQLDFSIRQGGYIKKVVVRDVDRYVVPFLNKKWVSIMMSLENKHRYGCLMYKNMIKKYYKKEFEYPLKNLGGIGYGSNVTLNHLNKIKNYSANILSNGKFLRSKKINYIDFDTELREDFHLNDLARRSINYLEKSDIFIKNSINYIYHNHMRKNINAGKELTLLISLYIYMEANK